MRVMASRALYIGVGVAIAVAIIAIIAALALMGPPPKKVVRVGALVPLTGGLASYGAGSRDAIALAVEDANKMCPGVRFEALFEDTGTDPTRALERLQALYARGARIVVGPMSSREVAAVKEFADRNKILIVSQSSTSPLLAIPGDWIYRVVPTDLAQARAIVDLLRRLNVTRAVILYRDDPWGAGLRDAVSREAAAAGVRIVAAEGYPPDPKEFPHAIPPALDKLARALGAPGTDAAVVFVSFEDDGIVAVRSADASPVLAKVRWVGTDGWAYSAALAEQAGEVLARHRTLGTIARPHPSDPRYAEFARRYRERYGRDPVAYDPYAYDAAMMLAQIICNLGTDDPERVRAELERWGREGRYTGVTGAVYLDENGDRAFPNYIIWGVKAVEGKPRYVDAGYYYGLNRTIEEFDREFFK